MRYLMIIALFVFASCSNTAMQEELIKLKAELNNANETIEELKEQIEPEGKLVHVVFLKVKPDADLDALVAEIKKLGDIEEVKDLEVGPFEDLGDDRALSEYNMMFEMSFDNADAYQAYQVHPTHLALRENTQSMMAGPPATYDYVKR